MSGLSLASIALGVYSQFLPSGAEGEKLLQVMSSFNLSIENQKVLPAVTFLSGESLSDQGNPVLNRVSLMEKENYDLWLMRQFISTEKSLPNPLPIWQKWSFVGILVDKAKVPPVAYYFEFDPESTSQGRLPNLIPFRAGCSHCHSSGPRVIRPKPSSNSVFSTIESKKNLLGEWNQKIADYRVVSDFISGHETKMFSLDIHSSELLKLSLCEQCHNQSQDAVRGPLRRKNADSILYLVKNHSMPMMEDGAVGLNSRKKNFPYKKVLDCLKAWTTSTQTLRNQELETNLTLETCVHSARFIKSSNKSSLKSDLKITPKVEHKMIFSDSTKSALSQVQVKDLSLGAKIEVSLGHKIEISGIKAQSIDLSCSQDSKCNGSLGLSLTDISTGIELRDQHLASWLKRHHALHWKVYFEFEDPFKDLSRTTQKDLNSSIIANVMREGQETDGSQAALTISCLNLTHLKMGSVREWTCQVKSTPTYFKVIDVDKPCFLGVCVSPFVTVSGRFILTEGSSSGLIPRIK